MSYLQKNEFSLIAHRGGPLIGPENTIEAFQESLKIYPHFIFEVDVRKTRDGEIVVMHDPSVDRTTNGHGDVTQLNYSEISKLKVCGTNAHPPLLKDVFSAFPHSRVTVEVKEAGYEKEVISIINKAGAGDRVALSCFEHRILTQLRSLAPHFCSGFSRREAGWMLLATKLNTPFIAPRRGDIFQIPLKTETNNIEVYSKTFLELSHKKSKRVHVWTINEEAVMRQLIKDGVDGIISDHPKLLFEVAKDMGKI